MRRTFNCDSDGILTDFTTATLDAVYEVTGRQFSPEDIYTWEVFDSLPSDIQARKNDVYSILKGAGGCAAIKPFPEAIEGIRRLSELVDVVVVTSPFKTSKTWVHEREHVLGAAFGKTIKHVIHTAYKAPVHGHFFMDDKSSHVTDWLNYWEQYPGMQCTGLYYETPRMEDVPLHSNALRVRGWDAVLEAVKERL